MIVFPEGSIFGYVDASTQGKYRVYCDPQKVDFKVFEASNSNNSLKVECVDIRNVSAFEKVPSGETTIFWSKYAKANGTYIFFHINEIDNGRIYSTLVAIGPEGIVGKYRKRKSHWVDQAFMTEGNEEKIISTPWGRFGLSICADLTEENIKNYSTSDINGILLSGQLGQEGSGSIWKPDFYPGTTDPPSFTQAVISRDAAQYRTNIFVSDDSTSFSTGIYYGDRFMNIEMGDFDTKYLNYPSELYERSLLMKEGIVYHRLTPTNCNGTEDDQQRQNVNP